MHKSTGNSRAHCKSCLHVENNLRIVSRTENARKYNKLEAG